MSKGKSHLITYKNTKEDLELYLWLSKKSSISGYVKDLLREQMEKEKKTEAKVMKGFLTLE